MKDNVEKNNKKKIIIVVVIMVSLLVVGIGTFIVWDKFFKEDDTYIIYLYRNKDGNNFCEEVNDDCVEENPLEIKTKKEDAKILNLTDDEFKGGNYAVYKDDYIYFYDIDNNEKIKLNLDTNKYNYFEFIGDSKKINGIGCYKEVDDVLEYSAFYNLDKKALMYEGKYTFSDAKNGYLNAEYCVKYNDDDEYELKCSINLLDMNEEKIIDKYENDNHIYNYSYEVISNKNNLLYLIRVKGYCTDLLNLYSNGKKIVSNLDNDLFYQGNNYVISGANNTIIKYDFDGNVLKKYKKYDSILQLFNFDNLSYAVVISDKKLVVVDLDNEKEYVVSNWNDSLFYNKYLSKFSYYENVDGKIDDLKLYLYVQDSEGTDFGTKYVFDLKTYEIDGYREHIDCVCYVG